MDRIRTMEALHTENPVIFSGKPVEYANAALILIHGRGADGHSILKISDYLDTEGMTLLAPQAAGNSWYPQRFLAPIVENEPWLSSALEAIRETLNIVVAGGIPPEKTILLGFSQGACLVLEFVARNPRRYGGVIGLSGGLIGEDSESSFEARKQLSKLSVNGTLLGTPIFIGCSDIDFHIPRYRVEESAKTLSMLGGQVDFRLYPGMDHVINDDELKAVQRIIDQIRSG